MKKMWKNTEMDNLFVATNRGKVYNQVINDTEKTLIEKALQRSFGNQSIAARLLGINRNTLRAKVKKLDIKVRSFKIV